MTAAREKTPAEFTKDMDEGEGAGPGSPETAEPRTGRPGSAGHGPKGPGGAAPEKVTPPDTGGDPATDDDGPGRSG